MARFPRCPACPIPEPGVCHPRRTGLNLMCHIPAYRPWIVAWGTEGGPPGAMPESATLGHMPCRHRVERVSPCGRIDWLCAWNHGQAGIIEPGQDCTENCSDREI